MLASICLYKYIVHRYATHCEIISLLENIQVNNIFNAYSNIAMYVACAQFGAKYKKSHAHHHTSNTNSDYILMLNFDKTPPPCACVCAPPLRGLSVARIRPPAFSSMHTAALQQLALPFCCCLRPATSHQSGAQDKKPQFSSDARDVRLVTQSHVTHTSAAIP